MKVTLRIFEDDSVLKVNVVAGGEKGEAMGPCPKCKKDPFLVCGTGKRASEDDRAYEADAVCLACESKVGVLRAEVDTLFGVREDEAVYSSYVKIY